MSKSIETASVDHRPPIVIAEEDLEPLSDIADSLLDALPEIARFLDEELTRARLMPLRRISTDVVTMNSTAEITMGESGRVDRLKLVYPADHVANGGCVSIASPVGVAMLGLREGQSFTWSSRHGDVRTLKVLKIVPPES
ncbi:MAG: nucleoside diphosphate kinase regulator [Parvibaculum sp.]|uniref:nucleoside diphosphate kinase regulator n=1 Tax=Parvibaculum sp. TaxID=2024848 RepID=UPI003C73DC18